MKTYTQSVSKIKESLSEFSFITDDNLLLEDAKLAFRTEVEKIKATKYIVIVNETINSIEYYQEIPTLTL
jgi:hypothetical protein